MADDLAKESQMVGGKGAKMDPRWIVLKRKFDNKDFHYKFYYKQRDSGDFGK